MSQDDPFGDDDLDPMNPYRPGNVAPAPRPTSGLAIASFICGIVFCVPMITSTLAIVFGIAGLRSTRSPYVGGRNWAISGILLGVVGIAFWLLAGAMLYLGITLYFAEVDKARTVSTEFVQAISEGKIADAAAMTTRNVDQAKLVEASQAIKASGPFNELLCEYRPLPLRNGTEFRMEVDGDAIFSRDRKRVSMTMITDGESYKIDRFTMD